MSRRKGIYAPLPTSIEEVTAIANSYALVSADVDAINAERAIRLAQVNADCDERIGPRLDQMKGMFALIKPWWEINGAAISGKLKSARVGGCEIGINLSKPKLTYANGESAASLLGKLMASTWMFRHQFLRVKTELDKDAIHAGLKQRVFGPWLTAFGFISAQQDEVYIKPIVPNRDEPSS